MNLIEIAGKQYKLATKSARKFAFILDLIVTGVGSFIAVLSLGLLLHLNVITFILSTVLFGFGNLVWRNTGTLFLILWFISLLLIDGIDNGQGFGKRVLSLQVLRLQDGKPCTLKDAIARRSVGLLQTFDRLFSRSEKRERIGDRFTETVVVVYEPGINQDQTKPEVERTEETLNDVIVNMTQRYANAKQKVNASIGIERQFRDAYQGAMAQAEKCEERATIAIQEKRDDSARDELVKRNEYRQLAKNYKAQWEEQKQVVEDLNTLLETLQKKIEEANRKKDIIIAQNRNVDAQQHLQKTLTEVQGSAAFDILNKMEQNSNESATIANAAADVDIELKNIMEQEEFENYAQETAIENEIAELKEKLKL